MQNNRDHRLGRKTFELGLTTTGALTLVVIVLLIGTVAYYVLGQVVPPGYFGVRQTTMGPTQGFTERGLPPGLRLAIPFVTKIHLVPQTVQMLNFHRLQPGENVPKGMEQDAMRGLEIRTSDGVAVNVDVSILTRFYIEPGEKNGGPRELFTRVGISEADWDNQIRRVAADTLRQSLGALVARQFYEEPVTRQAAIDKASVEMQKRLAPFGIEVVSVLLRRYTYSDDRIDEAIFNKNLQEQEERLKDAAGKLAEVKAQLERVAAEWDARIETLRIEGESKAKVLRSEAALFENQKKAEGDLAVAQAIAEVDRLRAEVLSKSTAADVHVARQLAPLLGSLRGGVVGNIDPYDLDAWASRLGIDPAAVRAQPKPQAPAVSAPGAAPRAAAVAPKVPPRVSPPEAEQKPAPEAAAGGSAPFESPAPSTSGGAQ